MQILIKFIDFFLPIFKCEKVSFTLCIFLIPSFSFRKQGISMKCITGICQHLNFFLLYRCFNSIIGSRKNIKTKKKIYSTGLKSQLNVKAMARVTILNGWSISLTGLHVQVLVARGPWPHQDHSDFHLLLE